MTHFLYEHDGQTYTIQLDRQPDGHFEAIIGDARYRFHAQETAPGRWFIQFDTESALVYTAAQQDQRYVAGLGQHYTFSTSENAPNRRRSRAGLGGGLSAQMPGQVLEVRVSVGDHVKQGETLLILEAMKMEIRVASPITGIVKRVAVSRGDVVERGQALVDVEPES